MALLEEWRKVAYNEKETEANIQKFWTDYFMFEKGVYEKLLANPDEKIEGESYEIFDPNNKYIIKI